METLRIGDIWYPVLTLGFGKRLGIWFQGCKRNCLNCISPELKSGFGGKIITVEKLKKMIPNIKEIDGLTISGGEPFDQPKGLLKVVQWFSECCNDDIIIFTGYTLQELRNKQSVVIEEILSNISVLIDGEYIDELNAGVGMRGSTNQTVYVWKNIDKYSDLETRERNIQCVLLKNKLWMIGIPPNRSQ